MNSSAKPEQKKVTRFAIWGALLLGLSGFLSGSFVCLYYKLPVPPLFVTELGMLVGGCLGALCALTGTEKRVLPTMASLLFTIPFSFFMEISRQYSVMTVLGFAAVVWTVCEPSTPKESGAWEQI